MTPDMQNQVALAHLLMMIHAHKCAQQERSANGEDVGQGLHCNDAVPGAPACHVWVRVLDHMATCSVGPTCLCKGGGDCFIDSVFCLGKMRVWKS